MGGIVVVNGDHTGIAPEASIVPLKVLDNDGDGNFVNVARALEWLVSSASESQVSVVCMSLQNMQNYVDDSELISGNPICSRIAEAVRDLNTLGIPTCIAAGNEFFNHNSAQGMSFPGILRDGVSVGAVYDDYEGPFAYKNGAHTTASGPDRVTPFSQRLHETTSATHYTDIFAPGAPVRSAGIHGNHGESIQHGTSQATPVTAGVLILMQEYYQREVGSMPSVSQLTDWLRRGGVNITDGDDGRDNVTNTGCDFLRVSAVGALNTIRRDLEMELVNSGNALKP